jgi:hypothetical protein
MKRSVWVLYYQGKFCEAYVTKARGLADIRYRMHKYYDQRKDYELIRYDASKR